MRYLVTGHRGFVCHYLISYILDREPQAEIFGFDLRIDPPFAAANIKEYEINLLDKKLVDSTIGEIRPDFVIHLASFSSVAYSWKDPIGCFQNNTTIFLNLLESIRIWNPACRVLSIGSSEEYGNVSPEDLPLKEDMKLIPVSPYAVARVAQEQLSVVFTKGYNLNIICTRSFNHIGPRQEDRFVVSSIVKKFTEFSHGSCNEITVGNIDVIRDFVDVRDVVRAYYELLHAENTRGNIFNICSGTGHSIRDIISIISQITGFYPKITVDPQLLRPVENATVIGSYDKINNYIGWQPQIPLEESIRNIIQWWHERD